jgi:hypothetical protein
MKRLSLILLAALIFTGCKNVFVDSILGNQSQSKNNEIYKVTINPLEHGAILAKPASGRAGTKITLAISPEFGYRLKAESLIYTTKSKEVTIDEKTRTFSLPAQDVTVSALFEPLPTGSYSVSVKIDNLEHGAIVALPEFGVENTPISLVVIPDPGYRYVPGSLKYNDILIDDLTRSFKLPGKHVLITAQFEPLPSVDIYTIRTGIFANGRIYASLEFAAAGTEVYLQVNPNPGYIMKGESLRYHDSTGIKAINTRTRNFIMPADHVTIDAEFVPVPGPEYYTISAGNTPGGHIIPESDHGKANEKIFIHVIPDSGYMLTPGSLKLKGAATDQKIDEGSHVCTMPAEHVFVEAKFEKLTTGIYTIRVEPLDHGRILADPPYGKDGTSIFIKIYPDSGYRLKPETLRYLTGPGSEVSIDEVSKNFSLPAEHITIKADFEELPRGTYMVFNTITADGYITPSPESGPGGTQIFLWVTPDPGYRYKAGTLKFTTNTTEQAASIPDDIRSFNLPYSHVQVSAEFEAIPNNQYTIRINPLSHGIIFANPESAAAGDSIKLTVKPDIKYGLKKGSLKYIGDDGETKPIGETFTMPGKHITLYAEFETIERVVHVDNALDGGQISVKPERAFPGQLVSLSIKSKNGYKYKANSLVYLNSEKKETLIDNKLMAFTMPNDDVTVTALFSPFIAIKDLKINGSPQTLTGGKMDYMFWVSSKYQEAEITFTVAEGVEITPQSGVKHQLKSLANAPVQYTVKDPDGITEFVYTFTIIKELISTEPVPAGSFWLAARGSRTITITKPYRIGTFEITRGEWMQVINGAAPSENNYPQEKITWYDTLIFCNKLSLLEKKTPVYSFNGVTDPGSWSISIGHVINPGTLDVNWDANGYRLPTEMEWLWAAMGADRENPGSPNQTGYKKSYSGYTNGWNIDHSVWYEPTAKGWLSRVGMKKANELGIYDMSGNLNEWCWDWFDESYTYNNIPTSTDYTGPSSGTERVIRGGCISSTAQKINLSNRTITGDPSNPSPLVRTFTGMRIMCRD